MTADPLPEDPPAQPSAAARSAMAAFILAEATALGIAIGTDGTEIVMLAPMRVPAETREWFYAQLYEHRAAVIDLIEADVAARMGATS